MVFWFVLTGDSDVVFFNSFLHQVIYQFVQSAFFDLLVVPRSFLLGNLLNCATIHHSNILRLKVNIPLNNQQLTESLI